MKGFGKSIFSGLSKISLLSIIGVQVFAPGPVYGDVIDCSINLLTPLEGMICNGSYRATLDQNLIKQITNVQSSCSDMDCLEQAHKKKVTLLARYLENQQSFVPFNDPDDFYVEPELKQALMEAKLQFRSGGEYLKLEHDHYLVSGGSREFPELDEIIPSEKSATRLIQSSTDIQHVELYKSEDWVKHLFTATLHTSGTESTDYYTVEMVREKKGKVRVTVENVFSFYEEFQTPKYGSIDPDKPMTCGRSPEKGSRPLEFIEVVDLNGDSIKDLDIAVKSVDCKTGVVKNIQEKIYVRKDGYSDK